MSLAAVSAGTEGAAGATVSMVMVSVGEADDRFPAASTARAVIAWTPSANVLAVTVVVVLLATSTPAAYSVMLAAPEGMLLVNVGVLSLVTLSVVDRPLSLEEFRFGKTGADGAVVSMVTVVAVEMPTFPATSGSVRAVRDLLPLVRVVLVIVQVPSAAATVLPTWVLLSYR